MIGFGWSDGIIGGSVASGDPWQSWKRQPVGKSAARAGDGADSRGTGKRGAGCWLQQELLDSPVSGHDGMEN